MDKSLEIKKSIRSDFDKFSKQAKNGNEIKIPFTTYCNVLFIFL